MTTPNLDDMCGQNIKFRQLIECGETQSECKLANLPKVPESYQALHDLAVNIIDPVIEHFGKVQITYGFCSHELSNAIPGRIYPPLDQHAAHEVKTNGNLICPRLGAAVDFSIADKNMLEVAQWIVSNTDFDRLYFYGEDRPIHVSFGPDHSKQAVRMVRSKNGNLMPSVTSVDKFTKLIPQA